MHPIAAVILEARTLRVPLLLAAVACATCIGSRQVAADAGAERALHDGSGRLAAGQDARGAQDERDAQEDRAGDRARRGSRRTAPLPPDWPRAGGFGPRGGDRLGVEGLVDGLVGGGADGLARRELTDEDLARVVEVAREVSPEWGDGLAARREQSPDQLRVLLRTSGRRLLGLAALKERAPEVYAAKIAELKAQAVTERVASELRRAEEAVEAVSGQGAAREAAEARVAELEQRLSAAAASQIDATLAARRAEIEALEQRLAAIRTEIAQDERARDAMAEEVVERIRSRRAGGSDRRGPSRDDARE
ncbi:MAG: hypothetical protein RLZZ238_1633 [Planctomycetota bacterium]